MLVFVGLVGKIQGLQFFTLNYELYQLDANLQ